MSSRDLAEAYLLNWVTISSHPSQKTIEHFFGGEMFILAYLARSGDASPTELADFSGTTTAHVAKALRNLEAKGEVNRLADPDDPRRKVVTIAEAGLRRTAAFREKVVGLLCGMMDDLGEADAEELVRLSRRMAEMFGQK